MQKRILTIFSPFLIAIIVRLIYVLWLYGFLCAGYVAENIDWVKYTMNSIGFFDTFSWDESWHYWGIVLILTFLAEMDIWRDEEDENHNWFMGHSVFALIFLAAIILFLIPPITSFVYTLPVWLGLWGSGSSDKDISTRELLLHNIYAANVFTAFVSFFISKCINEKSKFHYLAVIICVLFLILIIVKMAQGVDPTLGFVLLNILAYAIYYILLCIISYHNYRHSSTYQKK